MSGGEQQMLAMGRALMAAQGAAARRAQHGPEPDHGRQDLRGGGRHPRRGTTVLLVEQNASRALGWPTAAT
jgi:branched-chain amino acid transport system ATP-binding protein